MNRNNIKVLIGFEHSGIVCNAFRMAGYDAYSNDLKPGHMPQHHLQGDFFNVFERLKPDLCITHQPCTYLARGAQWIAHLPGRLEEMQLSVEQTIKIWHLPVPMLVMENPIGKLSTEWQRPSQVIYPWHFGEPYSKDIALWIRGLPHLIPEHTQQPEKLKKVANHVNSRMTKEQRQEIKSRFFPGVARAMAETWGQAAEFYLKNNSRPADELGTTGRQAPEDPGTNQGQNDVLNWWG